MRFSRQLVAFFTLSCIGCVQAGSEASLQPQNNFSKTVPNIGFTEATDESTQSYRLSGKSWELRFSEEGVKVRGAGVNGFSISFPNSRTGVRPEPRQALPGSINYLIGSDSANWSTGKSHYNALAYRDVWEGIDVVFSRSASQLKYDILVDAGADPSKARLQMNGVDAINLDDSGNLIIHSGEKRFSDKRPVAWQIINGRKVAREASFSVDGHTVSFVVKDHDPSYPLTIDPATDLSWGTFLGGDQFDSADEVHVDSDGYIYVTGESYSPGLNGTEGAYDSSHQNALVSDAFVAKISPDGSQLVFLTFLGGDIDDYGNGLAVDSNKNVYVAGYTDSANYPVTQGAFQTVHAGNLDGFVTKLNSNGSQIIWSTYLGGSRNDDWCYGIVLDSANNVCIAGQTGSQDFPTVPGSFDTTYNGAYDAFITKLAADGSVLIFSTFIGGMGPDWAKDIAISPAGSLYITGTTGSTDFPKQNAADNTLGGSYDAFVLRLDSTGGTIGYSTYVGGPGNDVGNAIAIDSLRNAYIVGSAGPNFATTPGAYDISFNGGQTDAFVAKVSTGGNTIVFSTLLGGSSDDNGYGIAVDSNNDVFVTGSTNSANFPTTPGAFKTTIDTAGDGFLAQLSSNGSVLSYSTAFGGSSIDTPISMDIGPDEAPVICGFTFSADFNVTAGAYDESYNTNGDMFIVKFFGEVTTDVTPPSTPVVSDEGVYTSSTDTLTAAWSANDPESGISEYEYAIGTTPTDPGSGYVVGWTSSGIMPGATVQGLSLQSGTTYYFYVRAKNGVNLTSSVGVSDGILAVSFTGLSTGEAKLKADTTGLVVTGIVTATAAQMGGNRIYIEAPGRSSGLALQSSQVVSIGQSVEASGVMATVGGERVLSAANLVPGAVGDPIAAVNMNGKVFASRDWFYNSVTGAGQRGVDSPSPSGTMTIGMFVRLTGSIVSQDSGYLYITDGGYQNGETLRISKLNLSGNYEPGQHIVAHGISSIVFIDGVHYAVLIPRGDSDLTIENP